MLNIENTALVYNLQILAFKSWMVIINYQGVRNSEVSVRLKKSIDLMRTKWWDCLQM